MRRPIAILVLIAGLLLAAVGVVTLRARSEDTRFFRESQRALGLDAGPE